MKNSISKIMASLFAILFCVPSWANGVDDVKLTPLAATAVAGVAIHAKAIDQIVTGVSITGDQMQQWKERKARYDACGLCGEMQPFPGDLPE